jgi:hypothetical protein
MAFNRGMSLRLTIAATVVNVCCSTLVALISARMSAFAFAGGGVCV